MNARLLTKKVILMIPALLMTVNTLATEGEGSAAPARASRSRSGGSTATTSKKRKAPACAVSVQTTREKALEMRGLETTVEVDPTVRITGVKLQGVEIPPPLAERDSNVQRAAAEKEKAKKFLADLLALDPDNEAEFVRKSSEMRERLVEIPGLEMTLDSSKFLDIPLARLKKMDNSAETVATSVQEFLAYVDRLNPDGHPLLTVTKGARFMGALGLKNVEQMMVENRKKYLEEVTSSREAINRIIGTFKAQVIQLKEDIVQMQEDRIQLLDMDKKIEAKIAEIIALDKVIMEHLPSTSDVSWERRFLVDEVLLPLRTMLIELRLTAQTVNNALVQNFANVHINQALIAAAERVLPRLTIELRVSAGAQAVARGQERMQNLIISANRTAARMSQANAETQAEITRRMTDEQTGEIATLRTVVGDYKEGAETLKSALQQREEHKRRFVREAASISEELSQLNDESREMVGVLRRGEAGRAPILGAQNQLTGDRVVEAAKAGEQATKLAQGLSRVAEGSERVMNMVRSYVKPPGGQN